MAFNMSIPELIKYLHCKAEEEYPEIYNKKTIIKTLNNASDKIITLTLVDKSFRYVDIYRLQLGLYYDGYRFSTEEFTLNPKEVEVLKL